MTLIVPGAEPLFFLDYYATGKLDVDTFRRDPQGLPKVVCNRAVRWSVAKRLKCRGCTTVRCDVAGFCVGVVEKSEIIDGSKVSDGDVLIALGSSGPHSNGYSLVRKILEVSGCDPQRLPELEGQSLADRLLAPTRIYVRSVLELIARSKCMPLHT